MPMPDEADGCGVSSSGRTWGNVCHKEDECHRMDRMHRRPALRIWLPINSAHFGKQARR